MELNDRSSLVHAQNRARALQAAVLLAIEDVEGNAETCHRRLTALSEAAHEASWQDLEALRALVEMTRCRKVVALEGESVAIDAVLEAIDSVLDSYPIMGDRPPSRLSTEVHRTLEAALALPRAPVEPTAMELVWRQSHPHCQHWGRDQDCITEAVLERSDTALRLCAPPRVHAHQVIMRALPQCIIAPDDAVEFAFSLSPLYPQDGPEDADVALQMVAQHIHVDAALVSAVGGARPLRSSSVRICGADVIVVMAIDVDSTAHAMTTRSRFRLSSQSCRRAHFPWRGDIDAFRGMPRDARPGACLDCKSTGNRQ